MRGDRAPAPQRPPIRAVVFDFDGLLCDTESSGYESVRDIFAEHGLTLTPAEWARRWVGRRSAGRWVEDLEAALGRRLDRPALVERRRKIHHGRALQAPLRPGALDRILEARAAGLPTAVASSSHRPWVTGHLQRLGVDRLIDVVVCGDDVGDRSKPDPAVFLAAADALGVPPASMVVFEDSSHGITAARAAGAGLVIAVPNDVTVHLDLSDADLVVGSLADITLAEVLAGTGRSPPRGPGEAAGRP